MGERARGAVLYGCAFALVAAGGTWWLSAAPRNVPDPQLERWRLSAERLLPDAESQDEADTLALAPGVDHQVVATTDAAEYVISVVCVGGSDSQVRVSLGTAGDDSGRGLSCADGNPPEIFKVGLAGQLQMNVTVNEAGPVVFRYALARNSPR
jgi:hypothetical protein